MSEGCRASALRWQGVKSNAATAEDLESTTSIVAVGRRGPRPQIAVDKHRRRSTPQRAALEPRPTMASIKSP
ncbi:hypothetical protein PHYSODRAFT_329113 [Phytophthora sojae]|uniref:Uncharacterized protein n=1 Tax=Phytophthora sojae (strain P6497) TaxID=1094619 RepID=G4Z8A8_PHYSP|nr:hypothetical protein PHYSODRAFT_329113 [Phytophthora sojae]EGZ21081.1 hypothetical protein PHYSODRAFT_329113 [Phytophthora sojae]|eukprot:XP_009523798.1 hypothetical protein PHYSODRAFT_329113 [Phytophthora sojae]